MTLRPDLTPDDEELASSFERFGKAFEPQVGDLTYLVLKSHLLFEELLRDFLAKQFQNPQALQGARLSFTQLLKLSQAAAATLEPDDWRWRALKELNRLRNAMAHEFEPDSIDSLMVRIVGIVGPEVGGTFPRVDQLPRHPETGAVHSQVFGLALHGLHAVLCVRLGFDANMRLLAERERASTVLNALRPSNAV
jgi:hypothetical protein